MTLNPDTIRTEITALLVAYPELDEDEILRADSIEGQTSAFEFFSQIVRKIGATQTLAAATADYIGELQERKERLERRAQILRGLIFKIMNAGMIKKAELPEATLSVRTGISKVVILNENELPPEFFRVKREPDKSRIKAALSAHENVPGAVLSNAEPSLAIIVK